LSAAGICFSPDSRYLVSVARDGTPADNRKGREPHTIKLWEVSSMTEVTNAPAGGGGFNSYPAFSPDGKFLAVDAWNFTIYAVPSLQKIAKQRGIQPVFSTNGHSLVYASRQRIVRRHSLAADAVEVVIGEVSSNIISLALSPDENTVVCSTYEDHGRSVQFWDVRRRQHLGTVTGHEGKVVKLAFSPDGQRFASAGWDGKVGVWDVAGRRLIKLLRGASGELYGVAFSPDGRTIVASGSDASIRLWSASTLQEIAVLRVHSMVQAVAFSPDGQWLAAAANGGTVHIWRAPLGRE
jgi:WD40 repeat protein